MLLSIFQIQPLVPVHQFDKLPSYYILAGLVFVPLTQPYLHEYGEDWYNASPRRLCERALRELPKKENQQLVILSQVSIFLTSNLFNYNVNLAEHMFVISTFHPLFLPQLLRLLHFTGSCKRIIVSLVLHFFAFSIVFLLLRLLHRIRHFKGHCRK